MSATVVAIHLSTASRAPLLSRDQALAIENRGLDGDRHAKPNSRRAVLLMEHETLQHLGLAPGDVREQVTVKGLGLMQLPFGSRLRVGDAVLEVAGPCAPCTRMDEIRTGLKHDLEGRRGRFVRVVQGGSFAVGDTFTIEPPA
jgi:MOSC domain-containing protein YiiM